MQYIVLIVVFMFGAAASSYARDIQQYTAPVCYEGDCANGDNYPLVRVGIRIPDTPEAKLGGHVHLSFDVAPEGGKPQNIEIIHSTNSYFDNIAKRYLGLWIYSSHEEDGVKKWRYEMIAKYHFFTSEEAEEFERQKVEKRLLEAEEKKRAELERRSYCKPAKEPVPEIPVECICQKDLVSSLTYTKAYLPEKSGYVAHLEESTVRKWDRKKDFDIKDYYYRPIRLVGECKQPALCTDGKHDLILGEPVDGPIEACVIHTHDWQSFSKENRTVQYGIVKNPMLFLQNLPQKPSGDAQPN